MFFPLLLWHEKAKIEHYRAIRFSNLRKAENVRDKKKRKMKQIDINSLDKIWNYSRWIVQVNDDNKH